MTLSYEQKIKMACIRLKYIEQNHLLTNGNFSKVAKDSQVKVTDLKKAYIEYKKEVIEVKKEVK